jgi:hypothetical protein
MSKIPPAKKRGRPRKTEKKSSRFTVWVSSETKDKLTREAEEVGVPLSSYAGDRLSRAREVYIAEADRKHLANVRFQLFKIDSHLQRLAVALEYLAAQKQAELPSLDWLERVAQEASRQLAQLDGGLYELRPFKGRK